MEKKEGVPCTKGLNQIPFLFDNPISTGSWKRKTVTNSTQKEKRKIIIYKGEQKSSWRLLVNVGSMHRGETQKQMKRKNY